MTEETTAPESTTLPALSLQQHALQELDAVNAGIAELEEKYRGVVYDVSTKEGMAQAKAARAEIRDPRYKAQNIQKETASKLAQASKAVKAMADDIGTRLQAIENPIHEQINQHELAIQQEREARQRAEQEQRAAIEADIQNIRNMPMNAVSATAEEIQVAIDQLTANTLEQFDEVWLPTAQQAKDAALDSLKRLHGERVTLEEQQAAIARQQAELAARQREDAAAAERREREAQVKREQEAAASAADQLAKDHVLDIRKIPANLIGKTAAQITDAAAEAATIDPEHERFGQHSDAARAAIRATVDELNKMATAAADQEQVAAQQAQRQAALDEQERTAAAERQRQAEEAEQQRQEAAQREREAQEQRDREAEAARAAADALAAKRAAVKLVVTMPDGSEWAVPAIRIANDIFESTNDQERADEVFTDAEALIDWAANNMNWDDVSDVAVQVAPPEATDYEEGWLYGVKNVVGQEALAEPSA